MTALLKGGDYQPGADAIQVMTMKVSKGLEFPVVALPGVGHMPAPATQRLVMGVGGEGVFCQSIV